MSDPTPSAPVTPEPAAPAAPATIVTSAPAPTGVTPAPVAPVALATPEPVYALTLPDGSPLEASAVERVTTFAKDSKLAPESAQKVLELAHAESAALIQRQTAEYQSKVTGWESTVKADKELGGDNYNRTLTRAKAVFDRFADPELKEAMNKTGFGNYPALVKFVEKIGAAMEGDQLMRPTTLPSNDSTTLDRMFPKSAAQVK